MARAAVSLFLTAALLTVTACHKSEASKPLADGTAVPPASAPSPASDAADTNAFLEANDKAIEDNKRTVAQLAAYQKADFPKYEKLRTACEGEVHGTLADPGAPAVAKCIISRW